MLTGGTYSFGSTVHWFCFGLSASFTSLILLLLHYNSHYRPTHKNNTLTSYYSKLILSLECLQSSSTDPSSSADIVTSQNSVTKSISSLRWRNSDYQQRREETTTSSLPHVSIEDKITGLYLKRKRVN
jgi:hypothetical protein